MDKEFRIHPGLVNYEAFRDCVIRNRRLKKLVGWVNNMGYLTFNVGKKNYLNQRIAYVAFNGFIKKWPCY